MAITLQKIIDIKKNLFHRSQAAIANYGSFDWHNKAEQVNSSQALAIDFWGCLKNSPEKDLIINNLFNKSCKDWSIEFEYTDKQLLNETKPTQIDVLIRCEEYAIIIESKFTENDGGGCSQVQEEKQNDFNGKVRTFHQCNGKYIEQINPKNNIKSKCALTGKGIKYWDYIDKLTKYKKANEYDECPFKGGEFQWMRNICFAAAYGIYHNKKTESYLVYYDSPKCPIAGKIKKNEYLGILTGEIIDPKSFKPYSYNEMLSKVIALMKSNPKEQQVWLDIQKWMEGKASRL